MQPWSIGQVYSSDKGLRCYTVGMLYVDHHCTIGSVGTCIYHELHLVIAGTSKPNRPTLQQLNNDVVNDIRSFDNTTKLAQLAIKLGLRWEKIDDILKTNNNSFSQLMAMFKEWELTALQYTWEALIAALRFVDEGDLADKLDNTYCKSS